VELVVRFAKYSPEATNRLTRIGIAKSKIDGADLLPSQEDEMRKISQAESVHYSNLIEGNELPLIDAKKAVGGELAVDDLAKIELVNYVNALSLIDELYAEGNLEYSAEVLLRIHGTLTHGLGGARRDITYFEAHHEGAWRDGPIEVKDPISGTVFHVGEPAPDVPAYMQWLCDYLNKNRERPAMYPAPVLAGVAHWALTWIHPFADGNGRMARLLTVMVLLKEGFLKRKIFSFERHYATDKSAYFGALRTVRRHDKSLNDWLEYFLDGLAQEYEQVASRVETLSRVSRYAREGTEVSARQEKALTTLVLRKQDAFSRTDYEEISGATSSQARRDLADLVESGALRLSRQGRSSSYRFAGTLAVTPSGVKWTHERIESELRGFLSGYGYWPTSKEWREAGKFDLYRVASIRGGVRKWRQLLGY